MITFQNETLAESIADLWETIRPGTPAAAHFREAADRERIEIAEDARHITRLWCDDVPALPDNVKHGGKCWQRHARCLADRILDDIA